MLVKLNHFPKDRGENEINLFETNVPASRQGTDSESNNHRCHHQSHLLKRGCPAWIGAPTVRQNGFVHFFLVG